MKTYKFKLEPTEEQKEKILQTINLCRWLYNSCLEQKIYAYKTYNKTISYYTQKKELPVLKKEIPAFKSVHSQVLQDVVKRLDKAYDSFFTRLQKGEKAGFPVFVVKIDTIHSFTHKVVLNWKENL